MEELEKLYGALVRDKKYTKSFDEFKVQFSDPKYQDKVFEVVSRDKLYTKDKNSFLEKYATPLKKKVDSQPGVSGSPSGFAPSQGIKPGTSVFPQQALGSQQFEPMAPEQRYKYKKEKGFGSQVMSSLEAGANTFNAGLAATPGFIYDVAGYPFRATGLSVPKAEELDAFGVINSYITSQKDNAEQIKKDAQIDPEIQKGIIENISNGNYVNAFKSAGLGIAESLPAMAGMVMTGGMGAGGAVATQTKMALPFMSNQWQDLISNPNMSEGEKIINAIVNGYSETIFEDKFGSLGLIKQAKKILASQGKEAAEQFVKKGFKESAEAAAKKFFPVTAPISNALEEGATRYMQNFNDLVTGKNPNQDLMDGVGEAMAQGGAFGVGIGGVTAVAKGAKKAVAENKPEVVDVIRTKLSEQLNNGQITQEEFDATNEYIANTEAINTKIPATIPVEQRERMIDLTADRNLLMAEQANLEQEASQADAAFTPRYTAQIESLQAKIDAHNDAILGLESPITYRQTEKGFEKVDGNRVEEITEEQFNYAKDNKLEGIEFDGVSEGVNEGEVQQPEAVAETEVVAEPEGVTQPLSNTDEIENSTGTYSFEIVNTINGPEKRYYRKEPKAKLEKTEISEEEYNLNTGATPVYDAEGNVDLAVIKNTPETGLTDEQFEAVKEKYYAKVSNGGSPGQAAQSAMTAARSYVGDRILTADQYQAIKKNLLPIASQYTGAVRKMQNPNIAEVQEQKDVLRNAYAERIMGWMDKLKTFAIDDEQRVLSAIRKQLGKGAKLAEAAYKNINRYSSKASQVIKEANNDIFKGLSKKLDFEFDGKKFSESELFSYFIQMDRIKNINQMMKDKFDRFETLRKKKDRTDEENKELRDTKKYLNDRRVLRSVAGGFELLPYEAGHSIDNAGADQNIEDIKNIVGEEKFSDFENRKTLYSDIYRLLLEEQLLAGIISQEQYDAMSKYDYAPTMHLDKLIDTELKSSRNAGGKVKSGNGLVALKGGSESALSDAYDVQLIFDINSTFKRVFSNRASRKLLEAARANPDNGLVELANPIIDPVTKMPKFDSKGNFRYPKAPSGYEYIPVFIDGAEYKLIAPAEFADMYKSGSAKLPKDIDNVVNFLAKITGVTFTRNLITGINPAFGVYQTVMDMPQAVIATDAFSPSFTVSMVQLGKQMGSVAKDVQTRSGWFTKAEDYGALQDMTTSEKNKIGDEVNWMGKRKSIDNSLLSQTIRKGEEFNQKFEHLTRVAVFKQMWEKLAKENPDMRQEDIGILAAAEAGKVVDYSRGGVFSKFMSKFLPYFNARIQVFRSSASGYKNNPTKLGIHSLELMAFTSMALAYTIGVADDDDEMLEEYLKQPQDMRNKFVLVRNKYSDDPDKMFVKLPIPAILIPIKVLFEESLLDALGKKDFNWENVANSFKELSPVDKAAFTSNPMMSAFIKYAYNKDMYYNKDIVVNETEKFDWTEGQNNPKIEEMYKQLGKLSNKIGFKEGISPERAKAAVESFGLRSNKNPFVSIPFGALDATLAYAAGNEEEVKNRIGSDIGEWVYKSSGIPSRVFASQAKIDAEFKELKADMTKEATLKREEDKKAYREAFEQGGEKALRKLLKDVGNEEDIVKTFKNEKLLGDRPGWYKELVFAPSNAEKAVVINYYLRNATAAKKKEVIKDLKKNFISSESEVWDEIVD